MVLKVFLALPLMLVSVGFEVSGNEEGRVRSVPFEFELQTPAGTLPGGDEAQVVFERTDGPEAQRIVVAARARQSVQLPAGSRWTVDFVVPGFWGPRTEIDTTDGATGSWVFNLRPAGKVAGTLTTRHGPLPKVLDIFGELPGGLRPQSRCPITERGRFECVLPGESRSLVLASGSFAPVRFREARVEVGKTFSLPATELQPGASLVGQVLLEDNSPPGSLPPATIRIFRFVAVSRADPTPPLPIIEQPLREDGAFSFVGLEPGAVVIEVTKAGYSPARLAPLELAAGIELQIPEALRLALPLDVVVEVDPPTDGFGRPWKVGLVPSAIGKAGGRHPQAFEGETDAEGRLHAPGLDRGRYLFRVEDNAGNRFHFDPELWLADPADAKIRVELPLIDVRGDVTFGGRPLRARLLFGGSFGTRRVETESDEDGRYAVTLPRPGRWRIDLEAEAISTRLSAEVEPRLDGRRAEVDLEIPDTHLFGTVVDEMGGKVAGAEVVVGLENDRLTLKSDAEGQFEIRGVAPGIHSLVAELRAGRPEVLMSDEVRREFLEDQSVGPVELRLLPLGHRRGRVLMPGGQPIPGAEVTVWSGGGRPSVGQARSDQDGGFSVRVDPRATTYVVLVMAPGAALAVTERANDGGPLDLVVEPQGGRLEISLPFESEEIQSRGYGLRLYRDGVELGLGHVNRWRRSLGLPADPQWKDRRIEIPKLAQGTYFACLGTSEGFAAALAAGNPAAAPGISCRGGFLAAGGELSLTLGAPPR